MLYLFQLVMIALLIVKRFVWVVLLLVPLGVTIIVHRVGARSLQRSWGAVSMRAAHELDLADAEAATVGAAAAVSGTEEQGQQAQEGQVISLSSPWDVALAQRDQGGVEQQQKQQQEGGAGSAGVMAAPSHKTPATTIASTWAELYRPTGQRLLLTGPQVEAGLAQQVEEMKQRLAQHNAAAAAAGSGQKAVRSSAV